VLEVAQQICPGHHYIFHQLLSFPFPYFWCSTLILSVQLGHFHKIINKPNTSISENIIWYKYLLLFDRVFSERFGRNI